MIVLKVLDSLIALMTVADRMGVNLQSVSNVFNRARSEGRDVTHDEVMAMAMRATMTKQDAQRLIDLMEDDDE